SADLVRSPGGSFVKLHGQALEVYRVESLGRCFFPQQTLEPLPAAAGRSLGVYSMRSRALYFGFATSSWHAELLITKRAAGRRVAFRDLLRRPLPDNAPASRATARPEVNHPVACADEVEVVFHQYDRVTPLGHYAIQHLEQASDVPRVEARRRLVEYQEQPLDLRASSCPRHP